MAGKQPDKIEAHDGYPHLMCDPESNMLYLALDGKRLRGVIDIQVNQTLQDVQRFTVTFINPGPIKETTDA